MQNIKNVTTLDGNNVELYIDLAANNLFVNNCKVAAVAMTAAVDGDEFYCGDLCVLWTAADDSSYEDNTSLLMRDTRDTTDNTATMSAFYWDNKFTDTLVLVLEQNGFSAAAAADICTSEWGMQDVGRASYDANTIAEEMVAAHNIKFVECAY
tara:strand:+ start:213 stop:671 length:459 start_codon:yes stop_codon:yes gene_type:complete